MKSSTLELDVPQPLTSGTVKNSEKLSSKDLKHVKETFQDLLQSKFNPEMKVDE